MATSGTRRPPRRGSPAPESVRPRSLAEDLRARDDSALAQLLAARPDLVHPVPADLSSLTTRATTQASVARALDRLDRGTLGILEAVAALPDPTTLAEVQAGLPHTGNAYVADKVDVLLSQALLWGSTDALHVVVTARQSFGDYPGGLGIAMAESRRGVRAYAENPSLVTSILEAGPPESRAAIERLTWGPPIGRVEGADRIITIESANTPLEWLLARHLLEPWDERTIMLPREVALALRSGALVRDVPELAPTVRAKTTRPLDLVDRTAGQQAFAFVRMVEDLLEAWSIAPATVLRSGGLGVRDLARAMSLLDTTETTVGVVIETAYAAGLLAADGEVDEVWCPTPAYDAWRARGTPERWGLLAQTWLLMTRTPALATQRDEGEARINLLTRDLDRAGAPDARRCLLEVLAGVPVGTLPEPDDVAVLLDWTRPRRRSTLRLLVTDTTSAEAELIGVTGLGALSTPGRLLLSTTTAEQSAAEARASARMPGRSTIPETLIAAISPLLPAPLDHVLLQADLTAVAPGPLEPELAHEMALLANVESTGGATVYRFAETTIRRALDAGRTSAEVLTFLEQHSRTPVPQPLTYLVSDVARRHGAIRVGTASAYLRCDDPAMLTTLMAERHLSSLRLMRLADTVIASPSPIDVVLERIREAGYAPSAESPDGVVVVRRPNERRTPPRPRPPRLSSDPPPVSPALLHAAVRALQAGEQAAAHRPVATTEHGGSGRLPRTTTSEALAALRETLDAGGSVWIGYADSGGMTTERVVEPLRLEGGFLTAYDLRSAEVRTFTVARITAVAPIASG